MKKMGPYYILFGYKSKLPQVNKIKEIENLIMGWSGGGRVIGVVLHVLVLSKVAFNAC